MTQLGFPGEYADGDVPYLSDAHTTKIGGHPAWLRDPPTLDLTCKSCRAPLLFLAQTFVPLKTERVVYIFGCNNLSCVDSEQSWRVYRFTSQDQLEFTEQQEETTPASIAKASTNDNGVDDDDWGVGGGWGSDDDGDDAKKGETDEDLSKDLERLLKLRDNKQSLIENSSSTSSTSSSTGSSTGSSSGDSSSNSSSKKGKVREGVKCFNGWYISWDDEQNYRAKGPDLSHAESLYAKYQQEQQQHQAAKTDSQGEGAAEEEWEEEYEQTGDKVFDKYQERLSRAPEQCIRYEFSGTPLMLSQQSLKAAQPIPACPHCHVPRVFEMQLLPNLLYHLDADSLSKDGKSGMEWGTVDVYVCPKDCRPGEFSREFCVLQPPL